MLKSKYEDMERVNGTADVGVGIGGVGGTEILCRRQVESTT